MLHKSNSKKSALVAVMYGNILVNSLISDLKYLIVPTIFGELKHSKDFLCECIITYIIACFCLCKS